MVKNLVKHGNSYAIIIEKPVMEILRINPDTDLELTTNGDSLLISPVRSGSKNDKLQAALKKINSRFGDDLRRLAE